MTKVNTILGIDIGTVTVKIVELDITSNGVRLVNYAIFPIPNIDDSVESSEEDRLERISFIVKDMLKEKKIKTTQAVVSISSRSVFTRFVKMPFSDTSKLERLINFEAQQQIPFPLEEVCWDYQIVGKNKDDEFEVLIAAIKQDDLNKQFQSLSRIGIMPSVFDIGSIACYNSLLYSQISEDDRCIILDIGANPAVMIVHHPEGYWMRTLSYSSISLTQALMQEFHIDYAEAESLKFNGHIFSDESLEKNENDVNYRINAIITKSAKKLYTEIIRSLNFYKAQFVDFEFDRIILCGGGSVLSSLQLYLSSKFKVSVDFANPLQNLKIGKNINASEINEIAYLFPEAVGLGLRAVADCKVELNLITVAANIEHALKKYLKYFYFSIVVLILVFGYASFLVKSKTNRLVVIKKEVQQKHADISNLKNKINNELNQFNLLSKKVMLYKEIGIDRDFWLKFLLEFNKKISDKMYLISFTTKVVDSELKGTLWKEKSKIIVISGVTQEKDDLTLFKEKIEASDLVSKVDIIKAYVDNESEHIQFQLNIELK